MMNYLFVVTCRLPRREQVQSTYVVIAPDWGTAVDCAKACRTREHPRYPDGDWQCEQVDRGLVEITR